MSFYCAVQGKVIHNQRANRVIVERRQKAYLDAEGNEIGHGWEIVKEILVSEAGLKQLDREKQETEKTTAQM